MKYKGYGFNKNLNIYIKKRTMAKQINIEELKTLIANGIKQENLNDALPADAVERIKNKILAFKKREAAKEIPEVVSEDVVTELDIPVLPAGGDDNKFPNETQITPSPEQQVDMTGNTDHFFMDAGSNQTEQPSQPKIGYVLELPDAIKKSAPAELFVFNYSDLNKSGENLTFKPLRLMDDPDVKMSMSDLWIKEAKTKADVYVAKFEKIGEINFNYADGTSKFIQTPSAPDYAGGPSYKENTYEAPSLPQIDGATKGELETYIKNSIDLEKVVTDIVMGIIKNSVLTNSEKALNVNEDIDSTDREIGGYGAREDQMVKPMEESIDHGDEEVEFNITMREIVEDESYQRIVIPEGLNEKINSGDKSLLIRENKEVQQWKFDGKTYFTPVGRISKDKGYIKS